MMSDPRFCDIRLETRRLTVRPLRLADAEQLHGVVSQPKVMRFLPEDVMKLAEVREIIEWLESCYRKNRPERILKWTLAIVWNRSSEVIGWCGLGPLDFEPSEIEVFCGLSQSFWGRGIAPEACRELLDYAFKVIGLERVVAVVDPANVQSIRLLEKLGMTLEKTVGILPAEFQHYEDFYFYSAAR
jgi:ribosomal-protein-alanine N-acetyltransferase